MDGKEQGTKYRKERKGENKGQVHLDGLKVPQQFTYATRTSVVTKECFQAPGNS